jgi:heme/copper-type cytochrome/quinol oxidase subunit 2
MRRLVRLLRLTGSLAHWLTASAIALLLLAPVALACPLCAEALFSPGESAAKSRLLWGYVVSVVTLLGIPVLLVGGIAIAITRAARRTNIRGWR